MGITIVDLMAILWAVPCGKQSYEYSVYSVTPFLQSSEAEPKQRPSHRTADQIGAVLPALVLSPSLCAIKLSTNTESRVAYDPYVLHLLLLKPLFKV
eukprot:scaffold948_cov106-Cylindrotheca_fusiformis.AAC.3